MHWIPNPTPTRPRGYSMPAAERTQSRAEESSFVSVGYERRLSPDAGLGSPCMSPSLVARDGKDRLFVDVRYINRFIRPRKFEYERNSGFLSSLLIDDHLASWDVRDALYHILLHPTNLQYLIFTVGDVFYEPHVHFVGLRLTSWAWTKFLHPVVASLPERGHKVKAYVDDCAATWRRGHLSTATDANNTGVEILALLRSLGLHVHPTDGLHTGTRAVSFLVFLLETHRRLLLLPASFLDTLVSVARMLLTTAFRNGHRMRHHSKIRLTGTAVSRSLVVSSTHPFLHRIFDSKSCIERAGPLDSR